MCYSDQPIQDPDDFIGRQHETRRILQMLKQEQSVSIVGDDKIGKTSLLYYVMHDSIFPRHGLTVNQHRFVYIDGYDLVLLSQSEAFGYIADRLRRVEPYQTGEYYTRPIQRFFELRQLCKQFARQGLKLVILLDHFDVIAENPRLDLAFLEGLRSLTNHNVAYLTASWKSLYALQIQVPRISGSPFFNIFHAFHLPALQEDEGFALLRNLLQREQVAVSPDLVRQVVGKVEKSPHTLRKAGDKIIAIYRENGLRWNEHCTRRLMAALP